MRSKGAVYHNGYNSMMLTDKQLTEVPVLEAWLSMCCDTPEFVSGYNRLHGTKLRFTLPPRAPIARMVDQACGHTPTLSNDEGELQQFFEHCPELLEMWPGLDDPRNFKQ